MVKAKALTLSARTSRPAAPAGAATDLVACLSIHAAELPAGDEKARKPVDVVLVVDKSGSMSGEKIARVRETCAFVIESGLAPVDRLGLVTFDSSVSTVFPLTRMDAAGKAACSSRVKTIQAGSNTNLSGGLFQGIELLQRADRPADVAAVCLLTDGMMNEGVTDRDKLCRMLTAALDNFPSGRRPSVFTFGYGSDADMDALRRIASSAGGNFFSVLSKEAVPLAFSDVIGGLSSVAAQNLELEVSLSGGAVFSGEPLTRFPVERAAPNRWMVKIKDMYAGESRDVLFKFTAPQLSGAAVFAAPTITVASQLRYVDCIAEMPVTLEAVADVMRTPGDKLSDDVPEDTEVVRQVARMETVQAMETARAHAERGDLRAADAVLDAATTHVKMELERVGVDEDQDDMMGEVLSDLAVSKKAMASATVFRTEGRARMMAAEMSHAAQRSNKADESISQSSGLLAGNEAKFSAYAAPAQKSLMASAKAAFRLS